MSEGHSLPAQLRAGDQLPAMGEEHLQNPQGLFPEPDVGASPAQFSSAHVQLERAEADDLRTGRFVLHPGCAEPPLVLLKPTTAPSSDPNYCLRFGSALHNLLISFKDFGEEKPPLRDPQGIDARVRSRRVRHYTTTNPAAEYG